MASFLLKQRKWEQVDDDVLMLRQISIATKNCYGLQITDAVFYVSTKFINTVNKREEDIKHYFLGTKHMWQVQLKTLQTLYHMEASISSEATATPFGASSACSWADTSSMAEFNCSIFSASILRVFCCQLQNTQPNI